MEIGRQSDKFFLVDTFGQAINLGEEIESLPPFAGQWPTQQASGGAS